MAHPLGLPVLKVGHHHSHLLLKAKPCHLRLHAYPLYVQSVISTSWQPYLQNISQIQSHLGIPPLPSLSKQVAFLTWWHLLLPPSRGHWRPQMTQRIRIKELEFFANSLQWLPSMLHTPTTANPLSISLCRNRTRSLYPVTMTSPFLRDTTQALLRASTSILHAGGLLLADTTVWRSTLGGLPAGLWQVSSLSSLTLICFSS